MPGSLKYWADKLAVEAEDGLTSAQLMVHLPISFTVTPTTRDIL